MTLAENPGIVEAVRGSVAVRFAGQIPSIQHVLHAGDEGRIILEVVSHLDSHTVRSIAMTPTRGLARGSGVVDTHQPLKVPVGERVLGRMFDVFGNTIDRKEPWKAANGGPFTPAPSR